MTKGWSRSRSRLLFLNVSRCVFHVVVSMTSISPGFFLSSAEVNFLTFHPCDVISLFFFFFFFFAFTLFLCIRHQIVIALLHIIHARQELVRWLYITYIQVFIHPYSNGTRYEDSRRKRGDIFIPYAGGHEGVIRICTWVAV